MVEILSDTTVIGLGAAPLGGIPTFQTIEMSTVPTLTPGNTYALRISNIGSTSLTYGTSSGNPYADGQLQVGNTIMLGVDLAFRTRMGRQQRLATDGPVGIGIESPEALLHIGPDIAHPMQLNRGGMVLLGSSLGPNMVMDTSRLQARANGAASDLLLNPFGGNVGIGLGTGAPTAKLHVGGVAGTDGVRFPDGTLQTTAYVRSKLLVSNYPISGLGTNTAVGFLLSVPDAEIGDCVVVNPRTELPSGLVIVSSRVSAAGTVLLKLRNVSSVPTTPAAVDFDIVLLK